MSIGEIAVGDLVKSVNGKLKGKCFITVDVKGGFAFIVDGKNRKVNNPKKKSVKHLERVSGEIPKEILTAINLGKPIANKKISKSVKALTEKV